MYERGHGLPQKGAIWHCRWQFVPPGETSDSPLACRSRGPAGQRSAQAPPSLGWQAHRDPQPRTSLQQQQVRGSRDSGSSSASKEQERKPAIQAPQARSLGRPDTGRLAVSPACRSMQDKLNVAPLCPAGRRAQLSSLPPWPCKHQPKVCCNCICARAGEPSAASASACRPTAKSCPNAGDIIPKGGPQT